MDTFLLSALLVLCSIAPSKTDLDNSSPLPIDKFPSEPQNHESGPRPAPGPCCCCPVSAPRTAPQCWTSYLSFCSTLFSPPTAKDLGDCRQSKPPYFMLCRWKVRMYYCGSTAPDETLPQPPAVTSYRNCSQPQCYKAIWGNRQQYSELEQPHWQWFPRGERLLVQQCLCIIIFCMYVPLNPISKTTSSRVKTAIWIKLGR